MARPLLLEDGQRPRGREEAESLAEVVRGALIEAGRVDLADQVMVAPEGGDSDRHWVLGRRMWIPLGDPIDWLTEDDEALVRKAGAVAGLFS